MLLFREFAGLTVITKSVHPVICHQNLETVYIGIEKKTDVLFSSGHLTITLEDILVFFPLRQIKTMKTLRSNLDLLRLMHSES